MSEKLEELAPNQIVRMSEGPKYFGYKHTQLPEKTKFGEIPAPFLLSDTGSAKGWSGRQIIEHERRLLAKQRA